MPMGWEAVDCGISVLRVPYFILAFNAKQWKTFNEHPRISSAGGSGKEHLEDTTAEPMRVPTPPIRPRMTSTHSSEDLELTAATPLFVSLVAETRHSRVLGASPEFC